MENIATETYDFKNSKWVNSNVNTIVNTTKSIVLSKLDIKIDSKKFIELTHYENSRVKRIVFDDDSKFINISTMFDNDSKVNNMLKDIKTVNNILIIGKLLNLEYDEMVYTIEYNREVNGTYFHLALLRTILYKYLSEYDKEIVEAALKMVMSGYEIENIYTLNEFSRTYLENHYKITQVNSDQQSKVSSLMLRFIFSMFLCFILLLKL